MLFTWKQQNRTFRGNENIYNFYDLFTFSHHNMLPCRERFPSEIPTTRSYPTAVQPCYSRHSYLLRDLSCITDFNPRVIARIMDKQMGVHTTYRNLEPPFLKLASSHPIIYAPNVDGTRAKIAFGRWALPKLKKQLHGEDVLAVMLALNSIHDLVHDPEKGFEAIRLGLIDRLAEMMLHEKDFIREKICMILCTLAGLEAGKRAIIRRYKILGNLALLIEDKVDAVRHKAQLALEMISLSPVAATGLNCADMMVLLLRLIGGSPKEEDETILTLQLATLKKLLDRDVKVLALQHNALNILMEKVEHPNEKIECLALDCIALLCQHPQGRAEAAEKELGVLLCKKLFHPSMDVKIKVAGALAFITIQSDTRSKMCKKCTVDILVEILENFHSSEGQLMAAKVLTNLSEDPKGKSLVNKMKGRIKAIFTNNNEDIDRHKNLLIRALKK